MDTGNTQDGAEPSLASAGSQPVAWAVFDGHDRMHLAPGYSEAESCAEDIGGEIVPLYRKPTLTDTERTCLGYAIRKMDAEYAAGPAGVLRELLERLS
jgi:hypothetical protein